MATSKTDYNSLGGGEIKSDLKTSPSILWVDDDKKIREIGLETIQALGYKGDFAENGEQAIKLLDKKNYDLVITDMIMTGMNGWQLADYIKEKFNGKIKVALLTGWDTQVSEDKKEKFGVNYILIKPFKLTKLKEIFDEISCK